MGPKISITKEIIIQATLELIKKEGGNVISARKVANEIGCSTQPIYRVFENIDSLLEAVCNEGEKIATKTMLRSDDEHGNFLGIGMGYFEFARTYPKLFQFLYMSGRRKLIINFKSEYASSLILHMKKDKYLEELSDESLKTLLRDMSIYSHGLCTAMISNKITDQDVHTYRDLIKEMGFNLSLFHILKAKKVIDIEKIKTRGEI